MLAMVVTRRCRHACILLLQEPESVLFMSYPIYMSLIRNILSSPKDKTFWKSHRETPALFSFRHPIPERLRQDENGTGWAPEIRKINPNDSHKDL